MRQIKDKLAANFTELRPWLALRPLVIQAHPEHLHLPASTSIHHNGCPLLSTNMFGTQHNFVIMNAMDESKME